MDLPGSVWLRSHWPLFRRILSKLYLTLVLILVVLIAWRLDWSAVRQAIGDLTPPIVLGAALLAVASHVAYSSFDLVGRRYTGHALPVSRVMAITFVSYVGTLNLGALIGAIGLRQRLYMHHGLSLNTTAQVFAISIITNWLGYLALLGAVLAGPAYAGLAHAGLERGEQSGPAWTMAGWPPAEWVVAFGVLALAAVALYTLVCIRSSGMPIRWRGTPLKLPGAGLALTQTLVSATSWLVNAGIIYVLLAGQVPFDWVLLTSLAAAFVGLVTHVPAGIGVLEGTFIIMLGGVVPLETVLAALIGYRFLFYLLPIPLAGGLWWWLERSRPSQRAPRFASRNVN